MDDRSGPRAVTGQSKPISTGDHAFKPPRSSFSKADGSLSEEDSSTTVQIMLDDVAGSLDTMKETLDGLKKEGSSRHQLSNIMFSDEDTGVSSSSPLSFDDVTEYIRHADSNMCVYEDKLDSKVEQIAVQNSPFGAFYPPVEKIKAITVPNFPALGRITAGRFLEWVQDHPGGVISLPTGKTPEHFIFWVKHFLETWDEVETQNQLQDSGLDPGRKPDMKSLYFFQIDEFYPIHSWQKNSFYSYVTRFYVKGFGLDPKKCRLIDCSRIGLLEGQKLEDLWPGMTVDLGLRFREPVSVLERAQKGAIRRIDQYCQNYEEAIRRKGGIGFFLGGIGPDGHIGFNVRGASHHSVTSLTKINYETAAAAAVDLGGIEISRNRLVITIGLGTITYNPDCVAVIIAAGQAKAQVIKNAIQNERDVLVPASALHVLSNARFYLTIGAGAQLGERVYTKLATAHAVSDQQAMEHLINLSVRLSRRLVDLTREDCEADRLVSEVLRKRPEGREALCRMAAEQLTQAIERGSHSLRHTKFLHTEPHHDDIMLGLLPLAVRNIRDATNVHNFVTMTSGFTSVTNEFMLKRIENVVAYLQTDTCQELVKAGYFAPDNSKCRQRDVWEYLDGVAAKNARKRRAGSSRRTLRDLLQVYQESSIEGVRNKIQELQFYFKNEYPGRKDPQEIQMLKGMVREFEAETLWGYFGWNVSSVDHLRLGFYRGEIFTEEPTHERDVKPIYDLLLKLKPKVVSVALDPEGSGPDTHYKVLQAVSEALRLYAKAEPALAKELRIWGYRNVWYRFHGSEANLIVPVSLNMLSVLESSFRNTFNSQKKASFPSHDHDGPFCELAQRIQVQQYGDIKACLGREFFNENNSPLVRGTRGLVFVREMDLREFYERSRALKEAAEARR